MRATFPRTAQLGDVIAAIFDRAADFSTDPEEVNRMATETVTRILRKSQRIHWRQETNKSLQDGLAGGPHV